MPILRTIEKQLKNITNRKQEPETSKGKRTFKQKRAEDQHKETLKMIGEIKQKVREEEK